ncbi:SMI1/KNR4 family protein [Lentzea sp. NEAU-D7]|uniref:SMI1/KNR4 family protein n=1 Tax=Lentzea sp. NEAU-D7 TaxID=2994667 RepID=UPI00224B16C8|nr:SMI1/KNR4 family protein [Lentzea sp. NEAU-D7]MCX2953346.1 hypothetical protein [Lentzea sp. NEAU-D7]
MDLLASWRAVLGDVGTPAPAVDWPAVESRLGTALPADYRVLAENYPALSIDGFMGVFHVVSEKDDESDLREFAERTLGYWRALRADLPDAVPHPLYPESGGLLPWGVTDNNDFLCWLTNGEPDEWPVVVTTVHEWWTYEGTMLSFLSGILRREIVCPVLTEDFPGEDYEVTAD